jgi:phosphatidylserine/phosphatidylglycerophosphate/cardiolipin synthase-like enzyme
MRKTDKKNGFSLQAISGTRAIMLAMNANQANLDGFLGFAVGTCEDDGEIHWLRGFKYFPSLVSDATRGQRFSTAEHPIQDFKWGLYWVDPETEYNVIVRPLFVPGNSDLSNLRAGADLKITIRTESEADGKHSILFNRGAIVSQKYSEKFDDSSLTEEELARQLNDPQSDRTRWLSRGLLEGLLEFINQARNGQFSLHGCFYELTYLPVLKALAAAAGRGAKVEVTYDAGFFKRSENQRVETKNGTRNANAIEPFTGLPNLTFHERIHYISITHNKFLVLSENNHPVQVWTGSTNITPSGFTGQSNTGHIIRDGRISQIYLDYWRMIAADKQREELKAFVNSHTPNPDAELEQDSVTALFSPRTGKSMLDWYGGQMNLADQTVMLTSAFGVTPKLAEYFNNDRDYLRYILMEQRSRSEAAREMLRRDRDTRIVMGQGLGVSGSHGNWQDIPGWQLESWMAREHNFRSSGHVFFVHTKYMLIDPLTDDPKIFTGSANFSPNSLTSNDENMLLIRGDRRVADVYLTEFMRLLNHFYFRQVANQKAKDGKSDPTVAHLSEDDSWVSGHFRAENYRSKRRELFGIQP